MSIIVIDSKVSVPMTNEQKQSYKEWLREKYSDYESYKRSMREDESIERYIRTNILTEDMKTILMESEAYVNVRSEELGVKRMQLYRQRIMNKMKYMKTKLGEYAYKEEIQEIRRQERERARVDTENRRINFLRMLMNEIGEERYRVLMNTPGINENNIFEYVRIQRPAQETGPVSVKYTKKEINEKEAMEGMKDDCCICMEKHSMNTVIECKCGHQMGKCCFQEWANKSKGHVYCPLCRGNCDTVWELKEQVMWSTNPLRGIRGNRGNQRFPQTPSL